MANEFSVVGKYIPKVDGPELVRGQAVFSIDEYLPRMLYGKILLSPHAHANIRSIDTSKAEALPGVRATLTYEDVLPIAIKKDTSREGYLVLENKVRFVGDEVAAVAADTEEIADEALKLIDVDYEVLPAVFDPEEALEPGAPILYPEFPEGNLIMGVTFVTELGDLEQGFTDSDRIYEEVFESYPQPVVPLGRLCTVAWWEGDRLMVIDSNQNPQEKQDQLADWFDIPNSKVRVTQKFMGAGMGETNTYRHLGIAPYLARKTNRPVKVITEARYHINGSPKRRANARVYLKAGVKEDGTPMAMSAKIYWNKGSDATGGPGPNRARLTSREQYIFPNYKDEVYGTYTNTSRNGSYRAWGSPEITFPLETFMDRIANDLGIDPLDYRLKYGGTSQTHTLMERAAERFEWKAKWHKPGERTLPNGKKHGIGMAFTTSAGAYGMAESSATIRLMRDGTAMLSIGVSDCGTGSKTTLSQVAAESLAMPFDHVLIAHGDSTLPRESGSYATRVAKAGGLAVYNAAQDLKSKVFDLVAPNLGVSPEDLDVGDGKVFSKTDPTKAMTWKEVAGYVGGWGMPYKGCLLGWGANVPTGVIDTTVSYACHMYEVEVDAETGGVEILKVLNAWDIGQCLNPGIVETQVTGCTHIGLGYAIMEDIVYDPETGFPLNASYLDYRLPTILELPDVDILLKEDEPNPCTPHGQRGVGEPPLTCGAPGLNNAIYNAIGVSSNTNPVTPDKILKLLGKA